MVFRGSGVALVTPFMENNIYEVDYAVLRDLAYTHISNKTDAIIVCGTTSSSKDIFVRNLNIFIFTKFRLLY